MSGNEMWTVKGAIAVFSTEEDAKVLSDFLNDGHTPRGSSGGSRYAVQKIYKDCYINKIKKGYDLYAVTMARDGTSSVKKTPRYAPNAFGFRRRSFLSGVRKIDGVDYYVKLMYFCCLAENEQDAVAQAERERIKTFLDDVWKIEDKYQVKADRNSKYFVDI